MCRVLQWFMQTHSQKSNKKLRMFWEPVAKASVNLARIIADGSSESLRSLPHILSFVLYTLVFRVWPNKAIVDIRPGIVESLWHWPLHTVAGVYVNNVSFYTQNTMRCIWHMKGLELDRQWDRQSKWSFFLITALYLPVIANQFIIKDLHIQEVTSGEWLLFQGKFHRFIPLWLQAVVNVLCLLCPPCVSNNAQITLKGTHIILYVHILWSIVHNV